MYNLCNYDLSAAHISSSAATAIIPTYRQTKSKWDTICETENAKIIQNSRIHLVVRVNINSIIHVHCLFNWFQWLGNMYIMHPNVQLSSTIWFFFVYTLWNFSENLNKFCVLKRSNFSWYGLGCYFRYVLRVYILCIYKRIIL